MVNVVNSALAKVQLSSQSISVYQSDALGNNLGTWTNAQAGQYVCVQISGTYKVSLPAFLPPAGVNAHDVPGGTAK